MAKDWSASLRYDLHTDQYNLAARAELPNGDRNFLIFSYEVVFGPIGPYAGTDNQGVDRTLLQALADELWRNGFRPRGYVGTEQAAAMRENLEDLRHVTRSLLDKITPR